MAFILLGIIIVVADAGNVKEYHVIKWFLKRESVKLCKNFENNSRRILICSCEYFRDENKIIIIDLGEVCLENYHSSCHCWNI